MNLQELEGRAVISVQELAALLQLSERSVYEGLRRGDFSEIALRIGGRWVIPAPRVLAFLGVARDNGHHDQDDAPT